MQIGDWISFSWHGGLRCFVDFAENARSVFLFLIRVRGYGTGTPFLAERAEARQAFFSSSRFHPDFTASRDISTPTDPGKPEPGFASFQFRGFVCRDLRAKKRHTPPGAPSAAPKANTARLEQRRVDRNALVVPYCYRPNLTVALLEQVIVPASHTL
jgi:hypothetical protein